MSVFDSPRTLCTAIDTSEKLCVFVISCQFLGLEHTVLGSRVDFLGCMNLVHSYRDVAKTLYFVNLGYRALFWGPVLTFDDP